jgi:hypothetical protein
LSWPRCVGWVSALFSQVPPAQVTPPYGCTPMRKGMAQAIGARRPPSPPDADSEDEMDDMYDFENSSAGASSAGAASGGPPKKFRKRGGTKNRRG